MKLTVYDKAMQKIWGNKGKLVYKVEKVDEGYIVTYKHYLNNQIIKKVIKLNHNGEIIE